MSIKSFHIKRDWVVENEEEIMEKISVFLRSMINVASFNSKVNILTLLGVFRDWNLIDKVYANVNKNSKQIESIKSSDIEYNLNFYLKYKSFAMYEFINICSGNFMWFMFLSPIFDMFSFRSLNIFLPKYAGIKSFGSGYYKQVNEGFALIEKYSHAFTIKESLSNLRLLTSNNSSDVPLLKKLIDHVFLSIMSQETPVMRFYLIYLLCNLPKLQSIGVKVPDTYYIFFYKAIIGADSLIFLDVPRFYLEYLEISVLPDLIKKLVLNVFFLNHRISRSILSSFENLERISQDESIEVKFSPIDYNHNFNPTYFVSQELNCFNMDEYRLVRILDIDSSVFKFLENKSEKEISGCINTIIRALSDKMTIKNRLMYIGHLIYLSRYNPKYIQNYIESKDQIYVHSILFTQRTTSFNTFTCCIL